MIVLGHTLLGHIVATLVPAVSGFCLLGMLRWPGTAHRAWAEQIGLSYLTGLLLIGIEMNICGLVGIPVSLGAILGLQLVPVGLFVRRLATATPRLPYAAPRFDRACLRPLRASWWKWILAVLIALELGYVLSMNLTEIRRTDDAFTWQLSLSQHTYHERSHVDFEMLREYPKLPGLVLAWFAVARGGWDEFAINLCFFNYCAVLLLLFHANLRAAAGATVALLGTYLLSAQPLLVNHAVLIGYADLPLALLLFLAGAYAYRFARGGLRDDLVLAAAFTLALPFIKLEGLTPYLFIATFVVAAAVAYRRRWLSPLQLWGATGLLIVLSLSAVVVLALVYGDRGPPFLHERLWYRIRPGNHWDQIASPLLDHFFLRYGTWSLAGVLSALALPALAAVLYRRVELVLGVFGVLLLISHLYLFCVGGAYEFLVNGTTVNRSFLQIVPTFLFATSIMVARLSGCDQGTAGRDRTPGR